MVECKSTKNKSIGIQRTPIDAKAMIQAHQINDLANAAGTDKDIISVFLFNYRNDEDINDNISYMMKIEDFSTFLVEQDKHSINKVDCVTYGAIVVSQKLKRTHYTYDIKEALDKLIQQKGVPDGDSAVHEDVQ